MKCGKSRENHPEMHNKTVNNSEKKLVDSIESKDQKRDGRKQRLVSYHLVLTEATRMTLNVPE